MTLQTTQEINSLHLEFQTYGRNAKEWIRKCQLLLPQIRDEEVWLKKGFGSIYEYAAKLAGMSNNSVNEALRVLDQVKDKPKLKEKIEQYGINRVKPILTIATENTQEFWVGKIEEMGQHTLKTYVREYKLKYGMKDLAEKSDPNGLAGQGQRVQGEVGNMSNGIICEDKDVDVDVDVDGCDMPDSPAESQKVAMYMKLDIRTIERLKKMKGERDWNEMLSEILDCYEGKGQGLSSGKLEGKIEGKSVEGSDGGGDNDSIVVNGKTKESIKPKPVNTGKPYVPAKIKKYVIAKTSGCCAYPGCAKDFEILHHTKRFALDSTHDPDTLVPLCKAHERIAHSGLIENEEEVPVEVVRNSDGNGDGNGKGNDEDGVNRSDDGYKGDSSEGIKINWCVKKQPDTNSRKYEIDQKVNQYYMPST